MMPIEECYYKVDLIDSEGSSPHTHTVTSEIIQTFENDGKILINGELHPMKKNGLYFIHGLSTHFVLPGDINKYNHSIIVLSTPDIERLCMFHNMTDAYKKVFLQKGGTFCELSPDDAIDVDRLFLSAYRIANDEHAYMKYARLAALFINLLEVGYTKSASDTVIDSKISDILSYINSNIFTKISLDSIADSINISKFHMCRTFQETMNTTIGNYIKNRRLAIAKQMLVESNDSINVIAQKCCFSSSSFFSKIFTQEIGCTPTEYRAKYK